jgi:hypothetical protein
MRIWESLTVPYVRDLRFTTLVSDDYRLLQRQRVILQSTENFVQVQFIFI